MNPFENTINDISKDIKNNSDMEISEFSKHDYKIEIWMEIFGRKKNTFISGWNIEESELKEHLKNIKKKIGCNGTIKKKNINSIDKIVVLLQGDHIVYMNNYLITNNINSECIHIKGI